jgi:2-keto-4-pentenoate hydratase/2-oxohepta-3-ene-1,7-dioic acid hydratase in catechol pathway
MRIVRFRDPGGTIRTGEFHEDIVEFAGEEFSVEDVDLLPPTNPSKIVAIGKNYVDHIEEYDLSMPDRPMLFLVPPNSIAGHGDIVRLPKGKETIEFEAEIGVVIGKACRDVSHENAIDVIRGFTCVNDISNRDDQLNRIEGGLDLYRGKAFDNSMPIGPVIATPDHVPEDATIRLWLNGELEQESSRSEFVFSIPRLIEDITENITLEEGDIISTGTPAGVGELQSGDTVEIELEGVGTLEHSAYQPT